MADIESFPSRLNDHQEYRIITQIELAKLIKDYCRHCRSNHSELYMEGVDDAPPWKRYEHEIWMLGESLRNFFKSRRKWRGKSILFDVIAEVLMDKNFGKGRQTFALLLGNYCRDEYANELGICLQDKEVYGHALKALTKNKIVGFSREAKRIIETDKGWIKRTANKYLDILKKS